MWSRRIGVVFIAVLAGLWDATIAPWFPAPLDAITCTLPFVVALAAFSSRERSVMAAIAGGIVLDILLPSNGGLVSIRYVLIALGVVALAQHVFTNRSFFGVSVLGAFSVTADRLLLPLLEALQRLLGRSIIGESSAGFVAECIWMVAVLCTTFLLFIAFSKRFLPLVSRTVSGKEVRPYTHV